jgi:hypothetical protein
MEILETYELELVSAGDLGVGDSPFFPIAQQGSDYFRLTEVLRAISGQRCW